MQTIDTVRFATPVCHLNALKSLLQEVISNKPQKIDGHRIQKLNLWINSEAVMKESRCPQEFNRVLLKNTLKFELSLKSKTDPIENSCQQISRLS
jgi:hypothetical protein